MHKQIIAPARVFGLQREKQLAEFFAFLTATTDDPKKIVAACVEESENGMCLIIRLAVKNGNLDDVKVGFKRKCESLRADRASRLVELWMNL